MKSGRRLRLRRLLEGLSRDWREAARANGIVVYAIAMLPVGAAFAFDCATAAVWAPMSDHGCDWAAWAGIAGILAERNAMKIGLSDLCAIATERQCASGLFLVSNSA